MYTYLALGDSYTIGEQVPPADSFPFQTVELLNKYISASNNNNKSFANPLIIARTGWTSDELNAAIGSTENLQQYDFVSLLVGVNDQYRNRNISLFKDDFDTLIQRAIGFAFNKPTHVFVLSIPDWGVTPFADGKDKKKIASEIDSYNNLCESAALHFHTNYINITTSQRPDGHLSAYLAADMLHPSGKEYAKWARALAGQIIKEIQ